MDSSIDTTANHNVISDERIKSFVLSLHKIEAIKFGSFKLKSGIQSPIYFDFRLIISHPEILKQIGELIWTIMTEKNLTYDTICGVPYTALPIATVVSIQHEIPMIMRRKEHKKHGTGNILEGKLHPNSTCLVLEDVVTTGSSVIETVDILRAHGINVTDTIVLLNRDQGSEANLAAKQIRLHPLLNVQQILELLHFEKKISADHLITTRKFFSDSIILAAENARIAAIVKSKIIPRIKSDVSKSLLEIMVKKESNLALAADLHNYKSVLAALEHLGEHICLVKIHMDMLNLESYEQVLLFRRRLHELAETHSFMIMEDRKLADIGAVVEKQLGSKPFEIEKLANFVTVHGLSGPGILKSISNAFPHIGIVLVAEMSSEGNLLTPEYKNNVSAMVDGYEKYISGFVSQSRTDRNVEYLQFTPGVGLNVGCDDLGQRYSTIQNAVEEKGADVIIVGRGILQAESNLWVDKALEFKTQGWNSWKIRLLKDQSNAV